MTQHNNTPQVKVTPQDPNYSHLNRPGASVEGDSHYLTLNYDKGGSEARNKDKLTSSPQVGGGAGDSVQKKSVPGGEEYDVLNNKVFLDFTLRINDQWAMTPPYFLWMYGGAIAPSREQLHCAPF